MSKTILVVEDDPAQRRATQATVEKLGYKALTASDGEAALDIMRGRDGESVDLVLLDLVMPRMNGEDVLDALRPERPTLPVIVLTAEAGIATAVQAMQAGATDFLVKPAAPARLQVSIDNCLKINRLATEVTRLARAATTG